MSAPFDLFAFGGCVGCADGLNGYGAARRDIAVIPAEAGIQVLNGIACGDAEKLWCRSPRGGGLPFFARAKKGNRKKARPECRARLLRSAALGPSRSHETSCLAGASRASLRATLRASSQSLAVLGRDTRGPNVKGNAVFVACAVRTPLVLILNFQPRWSEPSTAAQAGVARVGRNERSELRRMFFGRSVGYAATRLTHPTCKNTDQ